jgi:uncharacterized protein (DUF1697 family)
MTAYVGLLRGVNLGDSSRLRMSDLSDILRRLGYDGVRTVLQSGNVVFRHRGSDPVQLEQTLERAVAKELGLTTDFFVRSAFEWHRIFMQNPFPREAAADPAHLVVTVLKRAPARTDWNALISAIPGRERLRSSGREAYIVYPDGIGRSKLTATLVERKLGTRCTSRNWNTVQKLDQFVSA